MPNREIPLATELAKHFQTEFPERINEHIESVRNYILDEILKVSFQTCELELIAEEVLLKSNVIDGPLAVEINQTIYGSFYNILNPIFEEFITKGYNISMKQDIENGDQIIIKWGLNIRKSS